MRFRGVFVGGGDGPSEVRIAATPDIINAKACTQGVLPCAAGVGAGMGGPSYHQRRSFQLRLGSFSSFIQPTISSKSWKSVSLPVRSGSAVMKGRALRR